MTEEAQPPWTPETWNKSCSDYTNAFADGIASENAYMELMRLYRIGKAAHPDIRLPWQMAFEKPKP